MANSPQNPGIWYVGANPSAISGVVNAAIRFLTALVYVVSVSFGRSIAYRRGRILLMAAEAIPSGVFCGSLPV